MKRLLLLVTLIFTMATLSAQTKHTTHCFVEGKDPLYLDHYRAEGEGLHPCVLFAFGGGFSHGNRADERYMPYFDMLLAQGFDVVSIDYRLGMAYALDPNKEVGPIEGAWTMYRSVNMAAEDVLRALNYILINAVKMGIDISCIVASGSSAGAIAVLQAENHLTNHSHYAKNLSADYNFAGVIAFAGAIYGVLGEPKWGDTPCPIMMFHGNSDSNVPYRKASMFGVGFYGSELITDQLQKLGASYYFYSAKYRTHEMAEVPMYKNRNEIRSFIEHYVLGKSPMQTVVYVDNTAVEKRPTRFKVKEYLSSNYSE